MFKRKSRNELEVPPIAGSGNAVEVLRVWVEPDENQQYAVKTQWDDPGAWGIALVDIARHVANAYGREGKDANSALMRIKELFDTEWGDPTSDAEDITE